MWQRRSPAAAIISCVLLARSVVAQPPSAAPAPADPERAPKAPSERDLSSLLEPIRAKHNVPGMVAAIVEGARISAIGAAGVREAGKPDAVTVEDLFHIGSCTKS